MKFFCLSFYYWLLVKFHHGLRADIIICITSNLFRYILAPKPCSTWENVYICISAAFHSFSHLNWQLRSFSFFLKKALSIYFMIGLLMANLTQICLSRNVCFSHLLLSSIFVTFRISGWQLFSMHILKYRSTVILLPFCC